MLAPLTVLEQLKQTDRIALYISILDATASSVEPPSVTSALSVGSVIMLLSEQLSNVYVFFAQKICMTYYASFF